MDFEDLNQKTSQKRIIELTLFCDRTRAVINIIRNYHSVPWNKKCTIKIYSKKYCEFFIISDRYIPSIGFTKP